MCNGVRKKWVGGEDGKGVDVTSSELPLHLSVSSHREHRWLVVPASQAWPKHHNEI